MKTPRLLDLFCGGGGASMGYSRAGFRVTGVDILHQRHYPFKFIRADALDFLTRHGDEFDIVHASPPCQRFSTASFCRGDRGKHPDLLTPTLQVLAGRGQPWIIENVPMAPVGSYAITLCGLMFGLRVFRHRLFASNVLILAPSHPSHRGERIGERGMASVAGHGGQLVGFGRAKRHIPEGCRNMAGWKAAMGIDWMPRTNLVQAIPPAYTEFVGRQLMAMIRNRVGHGAGA